jgi:hypothetical protein
MNRICFLYNYKDNLYPVNITGQWGQISTLNISS